MTLPIIYHVTVDKSLQKASFFSYVNKMVIIVPTSEELLGKLRNNIQGTSLVIQWLRLCTPKAGVMGLIPYVTPLSQKKKKERTTNERIPTLFRFLCPGLHTHLSLSSASPSEEGAVYYFSFPLTDGEAGWRGGRIPPGLSTGVLPAAKPWAPSCHPWPSCQ